MNRPIAPWKMSLLAFVAACVVLGVAVYHPTRGASPFENGKVLGDALGAPAIVIAAVAYLVQYLRRKRFDERQ